MPININASFSNNRNNGFSTAKTPSTIFQVGDFVVYTGLGGIIPYSASEALLGVITGTFQIGETVTQATSGATGIVIALGTDFSANGIVVDTITGAFDTTHTVTGGTSDATMTPSSVVANNKILGLSNQQITAASSDWLDTDDLDVSTPVNIMDILDIPVSVGTPVLSMVGQYVNVDPANPGAVDVTTVGATGQILVTRIITSEAAPAGMIKGIIAQTVA